MSARSITFLSIRSWIACATPALLFCAGCGSNFVPTATQTSSAAAGHYNGKVFGGQQPVTGATITLYGVSSGGDGASATSLMNSGVTVTSDATGSFSITGDYTCPTAATYTYLLSQGGNPGLTSGTNNAAITLIAPLGLCSSLSASTYVIINEVTTVAAVAALYPYMTSYKAVGSAYSDAPLLATAMGLVNQYTNIASGTSPGTVPNGSTVPSTLLITLADAVSACVNSTGAVTGPTNPTPCYTLFHSATPSGGTTPSETVGALINLMNNPTNNPSGIFSIVPTSPPFQPALGTAPTSWALPIISGATQQVEFSSSTYAVNEAAGTVTLTVNRINGSTGAVSVHYATANGTNTVAATPGNALNGLTYTAATGSLNWADGDTSAKTFTVPIIDVGDSSNGLILFTAALSSPSGASLGVWSTATVTIKNNDAATVDFIMNANTYAVNESAGSVTVAIKRQNTQTGNVTVNYATTSLPIGTSGWGGGTNTMISAVGGTACSGAGGPDYVTVSGTQSWTSSTSSPQSVPAITICDRGLTDGGTRSFLFQLSTMTSGVALGESTYAVVTITDNDSNPGTIAMASTTANANENAGLAEIVVNRNGGSTGAVTVTYATANGTAIAGTDYTGVSAGTLNWAAGDQSSRIIAVPVTDEGLSTGSKTFTVTLTGITTGTATLGAPSTTVTIVDNDSSPGTIALSAAAYSVSESAGAATISVPRTGGSSGSASVTYTTQDSSALAGTDYTAASGTLTWAGGDAGTKTISVPIVDEKLSSGSKSFNVLLSNPTGAMFGSPTAAIVTINDNDSAGTAGSIQFSASSFTTTESSGSVTLTAKRTGGSTGAVSVNFATQDFSATAGTDYTANSGTLSWASGDTSAKTFSVSLTDVRLFSGTRTFYATLAAPSGGVVVGANASASVVISENDAIAYPTSDTFATAVDVSYSDFTDTVTKKAVTYTWGQFPAGDFGPDPVIYNTNPTDPKYVTLPLSTLPSPGVHPRLLFTAADLPAIQCRLTGTNCTGANSITVSGQLLYKKLQEYDAGLKGTYSDTAAYTSPDYLNGGYEGSHGNTFIRDYKDPTSLFYPANKVYNDLANGVQPTILSTGQPANTTTMWSLFTYEALYCLINNDTAGMQKLLAAATFELTNEQAARIAANTPTPYVATAGGGDAGFYFGYLYDWAYNSMTPAQVSQWTTELQNTTWAADNYGTLNAASASRSNWATFTYRTPQLMAIEGQTGYNDIKAAGLQRGLQNFLTYGIFPSGAFIEGEAKDQLGAESLTMLGRLGTTTTGYQNLFQHPNLQAYMMKFLPGSVIPNPAWVDPGSSFPSGPFVRYDLLGGTEFLNNNDPVTLHYIFPNNPVVDWLYQLQQGSSYQFMTQGIASTATGTGDYYDDFLTSVAYMTDFNPANTATSLNLPLTYFSGERALMMTRSDWSTNAMMLNMHTRQFNGGHPMDDRNAIYIFGAGRGWSAINQWNYYNNAQSIVNIDAPASAATPIAGETTPPVQGVTTPGRMVDFQDQTYATFAVGDASYCWDYTDTTNNPYTPAEIAAGNFTVPTGSILDPHSKNSFAYTKLVSDEMNLPLSSLPSWIDYSGIVTPVTRAPLFATPIVKAFRTAGLVRGPGNGVTPYGLVVDDIQVSATVAHHYDWQLLLVNDLQIMNQASLPSAEGVYDITLAANGVANPGDPVLLIRVLDMNTTCTISPCTPYILPASSTNTRADSNRPLLIIPSDSVSPNYKVLIFPYILGDALPATTWNAGHTAVTVTMPTYTDTITFSTAGSGKSDVNIVRGGQTILNLNTPIAPFQ